MVGSRLIALARAWFDETTVERVFEPLIADWQRECASLSGRRALVCRLQGGAAFVVTFLITFSREVRCPLPPGLAAATWLAVDTFASVGALVLVYVWQLSNSNLRGSVIWLLPSHFAIAIPIAVVPAAVLLLNLPGWQPRNVRHALLRIVTLNVLIMVVLTGWVSPHANQKYRESVVTSRAQATGAIARPVLRGVHELTLPELVASNPPLDRMVDGGYSRSLELHNRLSVILMPVCMLAVGIAASRGRRATTLRCLVWWVVCASVWFLAASVASSRIGAAGIAEPLLAWMPTATMLVLAVIAQWISSREPGDWTLPRWGSSISAA